MQPAVEKCGVCGARMPGSVGRSGSVSDGLSRHEAVRLALMLFALLIGIVACGVLAMAVFYALL
jgi:hypothetical protein